MPTNKKAKPLGKTGGGSKSPAKVSGEAKNKASREAKVKKTNGPQDKNSVKNHKQAAAAKPTALAPASKHPAVRTPIGKAASVSDLPRPAKIPEAASFRREASMRFVPPHPGNPVLAEKTELPLVYGEDEMVAMVRDPWWIFSYWEISPEKIKRGREQLGSVSSRCVIRLHDITEVEFNGKNSHFFKDHEVEFESGNFYLNVWEPNRVYVAELGLLDSRGRFVMLLRSNAVRTPRAQPSPDWGTEWARFAGVFEEIYQLSGGLSSLKSRSSEQLLGFKAELQFPSSPGMGSPSSPWGGGGGGKMRGFFLWAETELILYGGTEPDARLTVAGHPVKLRPDGTFSLRFALPDGEQVLRVHATSADEQEERSITPVVTKKTV